jgi:hypothetical protein
VARSFGIGQTAKFAEPAQSGLMCVLGWLARSEQKTRRRPIFLHSLRITLFQLAGVRGRKIFRIHKLCT